MPFAEWNPKMSVGVESIDAEHKQLIADLNELYEALHARKSKERLAEILDKLILSASVHFRNEEDCFEKTGYPDREAHGLEHEDLLRQIHKVQFQFENSPNGRLPLDIMLFLRDWLLEHIRGADKKYSAHLIANGIR